MISKELAKAVLGTSSKAIYSDGEVLACMINTHELANKCKVWARDNNYVLESGPYGTSDTDWYCVAEHRHQDNGIEFAEYCTSEQEAIVKVSELVLKYITCS